MCSRIRSALRCQSLRTCICGAITNRCVFPGDVWKASCWSSRGEKDLWLGGFLSRFHNIMSFKTTLLDTLSWVPRLVTFNRVSNERDPCDCEPLTDAESSGSVHALNFSSPGMMSFHETMVHANLRCLRRAVVDCKAQLSAERKLATLRLLCGKFVNMRHPSFLSGWKIRASGWHCL